MVELSQIAPGRTTILGHIGTLQEVLSTPELTHGVSACLVGIDNDRGRAEATRLLKRLGIPGIFYALSQDTYTYEVFVQEPGGPCWACVHPASST